MKNKASSEKKIRVTLDLTPQFYDRLKQLETITDAGTKANLIRNALQVYEYFAEKTLDGYSFRAIKDDHEENVVVLGALPAK